MGRSFFIVISELKWNFTGIIIYKSPFKQNFPYSGPFEVRFPLLLTPVPPLEGFVPITLNCSLESVLSFNLLYRFTPILFYIGLYQFPLISPVFTYFLFLLETFFSIPWLISLIYYFVIRFGNFKFLEVLF